MTTPGFTIGRNIAGQFGMPLYGVSGFLPFTGNYFWVDETNGSDGNTGGPQDPIKTLSQAHSLCTAGNNDVVFVTGSIHSTASVAWSKNNTHLIGLCDPIMRGKRARLSVSGTTAFSPLLNVTAQGCWFKNFQVFHGFATDALSTSYAVNEAGGRNMYDCVEVLGFGAAGTAGNANARALHIAGVGENTFRNCVLGVDTIQRGVANATIELAGGNPRNHFENCVLEMDASASTPVHLLIGADGIDRYLRFSECLFLNSVKSGATTIDQVANINGAAGGLIIMSRSTWLGATHWETTTTNQTYFDAPVYDTSDPALMANNA